jgi:hypothetical protein
VMRLLGVFNSFRLEQGVMNAHNCVRGLFSFLKYGISWVSSFLQQKTGKP